MKCLRLLVLLLLAAVSSHAMAERDKIILADIGQIKTLCDVTLRDMGYYCEFMPAEKVDATPADQTHYIVEDANCRTNIDFPKQELTWSDRLFGAKFCAQLLISERTDIAGAKYYQAQISILQAPSANDLNVYVAPRLVDAAAEHLAPIMPIAEIGSDSANRYLDGLDDAARKAKFVEDAKTLAAQRAKAAQVARENSPAFKRKRIMEDIDHCMTMIAEAQRQLEDDDRVAEISGYHDVLTRQNAAVTIVQCQNQISRDRATLAGL